MGKTTYLYAQLLFIPYAISCQYPSWNHIPYYLVYLLGQVIPLHRQAGIAAFIIYRLSKLDVDTKILPQNYVNYWIL